MKVVLNANWLLKISNNIQQNIGRCEKNMKSLFMSLQVQENLIHNVLDEYLSFTVIILHV